MNHYPQTTRSSETPPLQQLRRATEQAQAMQNFSTNYSNYPSASAHNSSHPKPPITPHTSSTHHSSNHSASQLSSATGFGTEQDAHTPPAPALLTCKAFTTTPTPSPHSNHNPSKPSLPALPLHNTHVAFKHLNTNTHPKPEKLEALVAPAAAHLGHSRSLVTAHRNFSLQGKRPFPTPLYASHKQRAPTQRT